MFKIKITILFATVLMLSVACGNKSSSKEKEVTTAVNVTEVVLKKIAEKYTYPGEIAPVKKTILSTKLMGEILIMNKEEGENVKKGEVLVVISSKELVAKKMQLKANYSETYLALTNAKKDYDRYLNLKKLKSISDKEFENVEMKYKMTKEKIKAVSQMLAELNETLKYTTVVAPYDGYITKKFVNKGDMANPGMPILAVESVGEIKITARIPESEIAFYKTGDEAVFNIKSLANFTGTAIINHINPSGEFTGKTYEVSLIPTKNNYPENVKTGMYTKITLNRNLVDKIIVPLKSIIKRGQLTGLWTLSKSNTAILRWVRTGKEYSNGVEILSGLSEGEFYITNSEKRLQEGNKLEILKLIKL